MSREKDFMRQYAAEIAKALQEKEETNGSSTSLNLSVEDSIYELYRSLCFDDPIIDESIKSNIVTVVSALCRQLLSSSTSNGTESNKKSSYSTATSSSSPSSPRPAPSLRPRSSSPPAPPPPTRLPSAPPPPPALSALLAELGGGD